MAVPTECRSPTECPSDDQLRALALGRLGDPEIESISSHVLACSRCASQLATLDPSDTLADAFRRLPQAAAALAHGAAVEHLIAKACQLKPCPSATGSADTAAISAGSSRAGAAEPADKPDAAAQIGALLSPPQAPDELGRLGPYRVLKLLDSGGMGMVFLAEDIQLQRLVALKAMKPHLAAAADARQRFLREARAAAALRHDNIVTIHHVGEDRGVLWLAMEFLEGESLASRLKREKRLDVLPAVRIARQIADALAAAHCRGLIHRDIKPGNVWLEAPCSPLAPREENPRGLVEGCEQRQSVTDSQRPLSAHGVSGRHFRVKVLDFGLARVLNDDVQLTRSGMVVGTPAYMAPEQARGDAVDPRCDLFSLGAVLYQMLAGQPPFRGKDTLALLTALATETPQPICELAPETPADLAELVHKLLAKDAHGRPQTAAEVAGALAAIENRLALPAAAGTTASGEAPTTAHPISPSRPLTPSPPLRISPGRIAIAAAAAALLIALAVVLSLRTPYGEVVVDLADGVKPDDVKIEVQGNGELKIADARHGWTIGVREGRYNVQLAGGKDRFDLDQHTVTISRKQKTHLTVSLKPALSPQQPDAPPAVAGPSDELAKRKPLYENDFSDWLPGFPRPHEDEDEAKLGVLSIRDGHYVIQSNVRNDFRWTDFAFLPGDVDIELVGRAVAGYWGFVVHDDNEPRYGVRIGVDSAGKPEVVRFSEPIKRHANIHKAVSIRPKSLASWKPEGQFNVLRAELQAGKLRLWMNGEEACEPFELPDAIAVPKIGVCAYTSGDSLHCEFDSVRIWHAGQGPPIEPPPTSLTGKPLYENDFSVSRPEWPGVVREGEWRSSIVGGRLQLESLGIDSKSVMGGAVPWIAGGADVEVVGRAKSGCWGFAAANGGEPRKGILICVDREGQVKARRVIVPPETPTVWTETPIAVTNKRPGKPRDGSYSVLRASINERFIRVWIDGEPACDDIALEEPLGVFRISLLGWAANGSLFNCEFDSFRIWQAGDGPPIGVQ